MKQILFDTIRYRFDETKDTLMFSIVDTIGACVETSDPRNYWKVLKNRLNKANHELVTKCNQLKMLASDGKWYLTDVADEQTIVKLLSLVAPETTGAFHIFSTNIASKMTRQSNSPIELSTALTNNTVFFSTKELAIDLIETNEYIVIRAFVPGVPQDQISILVGYEKIVITIPKIKIDSPKEYFLNELSQEPSQRSIDLSCPVDVHTTIAHVEHGLLTIRSQKINRGTLHPIQAQTNKRIIF